MRSVHDVPAPATLTMLHSTQVTLIRRLLDMLERGTTDMGAEPAQQPVDVYTSTQRLERERQLLQRVPIMLQSTARLREPGDFVTHDALGIPLLLSVDKAGDSGPSSMCVAIGARAWSTTPAGLRAMRSCAPTTAGPTPATVG